MASRPLTLYPAEQQAAPTTFCVTGASGYVAGPIVQRLLAAGHTVHATVRDPAKEASVAHLKALPGAAGRLKLFKADLLDKGSFKDAIAGCEYVIHTASPYVVYVPPGKGHELLVKPAVEGTQNVLESVNLTPSVKRVVQTSSCAAVYGDPEERGKGHVFTEADWTLTSSDTVLPYYHSKKLAEEKAIEMAAAQSRWTHVAINPAAVLGAPLSSRADSESISLVKGVLEGKMWPSAPLFGFGVIDNNDVAAAHVLAALLPEAKGRYILTNGSMWMKDIGDALKEKYPKYWYPCNSSVPKAMLLLAGPLLGLSRDFVRTQFGKLPLFDNTHAKQELGLQLRDVKLSIQDMAESLMERGLVKRK